jgi:hypothetical protein
MAEPPAERRINARLRLAVAGSNPVIVTAGILPRAALIHDVSQFGLGLLATFAPPIGSVLPVWLPGEPGQPSSLMLVIVIHVKPSTDSLHYIGTACHDESSTLTLREFLARLRLEVSTHEVPEDEPRGESA